MKIAKKCLNFWSSELGLKLRFRRWRHNIRWCHDHYARDFSTEALNESNPNLDLCHLAEQWASITMESAVVWHQMAHRRIWERHNYECYFRVCLVGGEIGGMKRKKKKKREGKWERVLFDKGEGEKFFWWVQIFSTQAHTKFVFPKWKENRMKWVWWWNDKIAHVQCTWAKSSWPFFFFFNCFLGMNVASLLLFFHFDILSVGVVLFCFFCFFGFLSLFCFNYISFCNNDIWVNLYKFIFFIFSLFHCQPNKNKEN